MSGGGVASAGPLVIDKIEINLDFHIFDILDFDLLLGFPLEKLLASQGNLDVTLRKTASATATSCLENSMAKHFPEPNSLKVMMHESPFIPSESILSEVAKSAASKEHDSEVTLHFCEDERSLSLLSEFEPLPSGPGEVVLDHDRDSTMISHYESLEMENRWAMEFCEARTLESDEKDSTDEHGTIIFETPCSFNATPESGMLSAPCTH